MRGRRHSACAMSQISDFDPLFFTASSDANWTFRNACLNHRPGPLVLIDAYLFIFAELDFLNCYQLAISFRFNYFSRRVS